MRLVVVTGIVGIFFGQIAALAQDGPPATDGTDAPCADFRDPGGPQRLSCGCHRGGWGCWRHRGEHPDRRDDLAAARDRPRVGGDRTSDSWRRVLRCTRGGLARLCLCQRASGCRECRCTGRCGTPGRLYDSKHARSRIWRERPQSRGARRKCRNLPGRKGRILVGATVRPRGGRRIKLRAIMCLPPALVILPTRLLVE